LDARPQRVRRRWTLAIATALGLFGVVANIGVAVASPATWSSQQLRNFVGFQNDVSDVTGHPLDGDVTQGALLPLNASAGQLFIAGNCDGLYQANGQANVNGVVTRSDPLIQQAFELSFGWVPVERGSSIRHTVELSIHAPLSGTEPAVLLATIGGDHPSSLSVRPSGPGLVQFTMSGPGGTSMSGPMAVDVGTTYRLSVVLDTYLHSFSVAFPQGQPFSGYLGSVGTVVMKASPSTGDGHALSVAVRGHPKPLPPDSLCQKLRSRAEPAAGSARPQPSATMVRERSRAS
jgi:hypothetical protein